MATWATDVRGLNLARHVPTAAEKHVAGIIKRRWAKWQPLLLHEFRKHAQPPGYVAKEMLRLEAVHTARIFRLLDHYRHVNPRWHGSRIQEYDTDDPRIPEAEFDRKLAIAVNSRRARRASRERRAMESHRG